MHLREWLDKNSLNMFKFCKMYKLSYFSIYNYVKHNTHLGAKNAIRIEEITNGEVSRVEALWPDYIYKPNNTKEHNESK